LSDLLVLARGRDDERGLAEVEGLADRLEAGGAHVRAASLEVPEERVLVERVRVEARGGLGR
jgi:hypothetical protein